MATEALNRLRYHASRLVAMPMAAVRQIGVVMVSEIDAAMIAVPAPAIVAPDLGETATEAILRELDRRLAKAGAGSESVEELAAEIARRIRHMQDRRKATKAMREMRKG